MRPIDTVDTPLSSARRGTTSLGACVALLAVPALIVVAGLSVLQAKDQVHGLSGQFQAARWAAWACALTSGLVAGAFARALWRLGPPWELPRQQAAFLGLGAWVGGFLLLVFGACGTVNRAIGDLTFETALVQTSFRVAGRGCHHVLEVVGRTVPSGTRLCADEARWDALQSGDSLPLVRVASRLGEQVGVMPAGTSAFKEEGR